MREDHSCNMKGVPWLEVMCSGMLKRLIHPDRRAEA